MDFSRDVELEAADDFATRAALRESSGHVVLGRLVPSQSADDDDVERGVGLPVATAVESVTFPMLFVVFPIASIWLIVAARRVVVSRGAQLAVVALPPEAVALLGAGYRRDIRDGGGTIPRHPLMASESGLQIDINGAHHDRPNLRERSILVELTASRSGLLSRCVLCLGERRVTVRVRGRLQLKRPVRSTPGDLINPSGSA